MFTRRDLIMAGSIIVAASNAVTAEAAEAARKLVSEDWTWMQDYAFMWATWTLNCPADRTCQVGMGVMAFGEPRGEKIRFSGAQRITTLGLGAIHVRAVDGRGDCPVRLDEGDVGLIPILRGDFP